MKKLIALLMALAMIVSLVACEAVPQGTTPAGTEKAEEADEEEPAAEPADAGTDVSEWPVLKIEVVPMSDFSGEADVEPALNEYLQSIDAGFQVDIFTLEFGERATALTLMLADTSNPVDLYTWRWYSNVSSLVKNDQCISLEPYREKYPEMFNLYPEGAYKACQVNGEQYSIPIADAFCTFEYFALRKDIAEEVGVLDKVDQMITVDELTEILTKCKEAHPEMSWANDMNQPTFQGIDNLGNDNAIGVLMNRGVGTTEIVDYYETDEWKDYIQLAKEWEEAGFFMEDPLNNPAIPGDLVKNGLMGGFFGEAYSLEDAYFNVASYIANYEMCIFQLSGMGGTNSVVSGGWQISSICKYPDEAAHMLNLMCTDETVARLFGNGVEGKQYQLDENGCAHYLEGKDANNCGWHLTAPWFYPNKTLMYPFETDDPEALSKCKTAWENKDVQYSNGMGFVFDDSAVKDEYTACAGVVGEYRKALLYGQVDVEEYNTRFVEELKENGIDDIIAEMNRQFSEFLSTAK